MKVTRNARVGTPAPVVTTRTVKAKVQRTSALASMPDPAAVLARLIESDAFNKLGCKFFALFGRSVGTDGNTEGTPVLAPVTQLVYVDKQGREADLFGTKGTPARDPRGDGKGYYLSTDRESVATITGLDLLHKPWSVGDEESAGRLATSFDRFYLLCDEGTIVQRETGASTGDKRTDHFPLSVAKPGGSTYTAGDRAHFADDDGETWNVSCSLMAKQDGTVRANIRVHQTGVVRSDTDLSDLAYVLDTYGKSARPEMVEAVAAIEAAIGTKP